MSVSSLVMAGMVALPSVALADAPQVEAPTGVTSAAMHKSGSKMIDRAFDAAQLRPDQQRQVEQLRSEWRQRHAPAKEARRELMVAVADQIEQGDIDRCGLESEVSSLASAKAKARAGDRAAMDKLHSILDAQQRGRFVDTLREQFDEMKRAHSPKEMASELDQKLDLTDEQQASLERVLGGLRQIRDAQPAFTEHKAQMKRVLDAFKGDQFAIDEVMPMRGDAVERETKRIEARLWAAEAVIPILNEQQRARVADMIRDKAQRHSETERGTETSVKPGERGREQGLDHRSQGQQQRAQSADQDDDDMED